MGNSLNIAPISHEICFIYLYVAWRLFLKAITQKAKRSGNFSSYRNILQSFCMKKKDRDVRMVEARSRVSNIILDCIRVDFLSIMC